MAKRDEFEEEMRKADAAAYRASLSDEPGAESTKDFMKRTGTKATPPKATVGGPKIVTKEQMQKAGFDNLRDYMNAQKGLKRRSEKGPDTATLDRIASKQSDESKGPSNADLDRLDKQSDIKKDRPGSEVIAEKQEQSQPKMKAAYREAFGNIRKALGFKSGGAVKVSSASKRADGCAVKGKTRGKMV
jgi:hypothetical protein